MKEIFPGVYMINGLLATLNSTPGHRVYGEKLVHQRGREYRIWDPFRSKLAAGIRRGLKSFPINRNSNVLYLGASSGTTASHVADVTGGVVYCVEVSKRMMRELMPVCERKNNMIPILADARHPKEYARLISRVDMVYQDVAQKNQAEILLSNTQQFKPSHAMLAIKARSISSVANPKQVFRDEIDKLKQEYDILESLDLQPYDKDHMLVNLKHKK